LRTRPRYVLRDELDRRLRILLPPEYHETYATIEAKPMGSAGLTYDAEGRVAWNTIWQAFCDLAMAGGPPHKGKLLGPGDPDDIGARPGEYLDVIEELGRGITLASELPADDSPNLGWIRVQCHSEVMAGWMLRAITMENVAVRAEGRALDLPAAPDFRLDKEIKNVVTVTAKTCHYWTSHIPREQKVEIGELFASLDRESPLLGPGWDEGGDHWRGVECESVQQALTMMRALIALNVLSRREDTTVFVPINATDDPGGQIVATALKQLP
jgi:sirohydrochlorin cobaltochelatase